MSCPSPKVTEDLVQSLAKNYIRDVSVSGLKLRIGFVMDDVQSVRELEQFYPSIASNLVYVSDPKVFAFDDSGVKLYKGESLVIEGENLRLASSEQEVNVTIGTRICNITSLSMTQLVCLPPDLQPLGNRWNRASKRQRIAFSCRQNRESSLRYRIPSIWSVSRLWNASTRELDCL